MLLEWGPVLFSVEVVAVAFFDYPGSSESERTELPFLAGASSDDWKALLKHLSAEKFVAGQTLMKAGDPADAFFILAEGSVEVDTPVSQRRRAIARIEAGSIFGEIGFLDGGVRTATVRAVTDGTMMRVTHSGYAILQSWQPQLTQRIAMDLGRICATRLRRLLRLLAR